MSKLDVHTQLSAALLLVSAVAFTIWQVTELSIVKPMLTIGFSDKIAPVMVILWMGATLLLIVRSRGRSAASLEDEMTRQNRYIAFSDGYWGVMIFAGAGLIAATRTNLPAIDIVRLILIAGVAVPIIYFAFLERNGAYGD